MVKEGLSFDAISRINVTTGDLFTLRATDIYHGESRYFDRILTGKINQWQAPETYDPNDGDFWTAWFDPSVYWKVNDTGVQNKTSWLWERHKTTPFEDPADHPPGIQTNCAERVTLVVPYPAFESDDYWYYNPAPAGYVTALEIGISHPHRLLKDDEAAPEDEEVTNV